MSDEEIHESADGISPMDPRQFKKQQLDRPGAGWHRMETGPRGPAWYPPVTEGAVDPTKEHLALCPLDSDRKPGAPVALVGCRDDDTLFVQYLDRSAETVEGVERLFYSCFEEVGVLPVFELVQRSTFPKALVQPYN